MLTDAYLNRLDALRLAMQSRAQGGAGGLRRSRSLGSSAEFSDFREYAPGDDIRRLDWNAYARFDRLFMKLFMEEQESCVTVVVDGSASMEAKREDALKAAEALCYLALTGGDRLRIAWLNADGAQMSPLLTGRRSHPRAVEFLASRPMAGGTALMEGIRRIDPLPKGMCLLVSDGYVEEGMGKVLDLLRYRRQECAFVQLLSPLEMRPELEGAVRLKDAEGAPDVDILADGIALRQYRQALEAFLRDCREACHRRGAAYLLLDGGAPFEDAFLPALARSGLV